mgnify:FL=1
MGMFFNGAKCDIYIGKGAGKKLLHDIENANDSVKIMSPYLSPNLIKELINLHSRNIPVQLITTDNIEDYKKDQEKIIYKLILQNRESDYEAILKRNKLNKIKTIFGYLTFALVIAVCGSYAYFIDLRVALGIIPIILFFTINRIYKSLVKNKRIYNYWYSQLFPFKVFMSPYQTELSDTFIHGKIYIIDDRIAYLGSMNFTTSAAKYNYETRIRITDPRALKEINDEFHELFNNSNLPIRDIQFWGKQLYQEPIN